MDKVLATGDDNFLLKVAVKATRCKINVAHGIDLDDVYAVADKVATREANRIERTVDATYALRRKVRTLKAAA